MTSINPLFQNSFPNSFSVGASPNAYGGLLYNNPSQSIAGSQNYNFSQPLFNANNGSGNGAWNNPTYGTPNQFGGLVQDLGMNALTKSTFGQNVTSSVTNAINNFGSTQFGIGNVYSGSIGPTASGAPLSATSINGASGVGLSSYLGGAGLGAGVGGLAANLTGGNPVGGSIGGGLGGLAAAGMGFGPVGWAIGGALGGGLGGLFGGKKPSDKTQSGGVSLQTGEINPDYATKWSMTGKKFSQENASVRDKVQQGLYNFNQYLKQNGASLKYGDKEDRDVIFQVGARDGYKVWLFGEQDPKSFSNYNDASVHMVNRMLEAYDLPPELESQIKAMQEKGIFNDISAFTGQNSSVTGGMMFAPAFGAMPMVQGKTNTPSAGQKSFANFVQQYRSTQSPA